MFAIPKPTSVTLVCSYNLGEFEQFCAAHHLISEAKLRKLVGAIQDDTLSDEQRKTIGSVKLAKLKTATNEEQASAYRAVEKALIAGRRSLGLNLYTSVKDACAATLTLKERIADVFCLQNTDNGRPLRLKLIGLDYEEFSFDKSSKTAVWLRKGLFETVQNQSTDANVAVVTGTHATTKVETTFVSLFLEDAKQLTAVKALAERRNVFIGLSETSHMFKSLSGYKILKDANVIGVPLPGEDSKAPHQPNYFAVRGSVDIVQMMDMGAGFVSVDDQDKFAIPALESAINPSIHFPIYGGVRLAKTMTKAACVLS